MDKKLHDRVYELKDEILQNRRWIHQHAELSFHEIETSNYIYSVLEKIDGGLILSRPTATSVMAVIQTGRPGPVIAARADIDALPMEECNGLPFASQNKGAMHSCGHDGHAAILLETAKILTERKDELCGEIRLIFQHAEETPPGGAPEVIAAGVLDGVQEVYGLHLVSVQKTGSFGVRPGVLTSATDRFDIIVKGSGGHSSMPYACIDPITTGAEIITGIQTILSRRIKASEQAVISICQVNSGEAYNIIPDDMKIIGSVRTYSSEVRATIKRLLGEISEGIAGAHGAKAEYIYSEGYDSVYNDPELTAAAEELIAEQFGKDKIEHIGLVVPGDDFFTYQKVCPGFFLELGTGNEEKGTTYPHHNPKYLMDEDALPIGVEYLTALLMRRSKQQ